MTAHDILNKSKRYRLTRRADKLLTRPGLLGQISLRISISTPKARLMEDHMDLKSLVVNTDPLALIALGGFVAVLVVSLGLLIFMMRKLPSKR